MVRTLPLAVACLAVAGFASPSLAQVGIRLNGPLPHAIAGDVTTDQFDALTISPDGAWIVYRADGDTDDVFELYSVPAAGGTVRKLTAPMVPQEWVTSYSITADSSRVVFHVHTSATPHFNRLYSVPIDGSSAAVELAPSVEDIDVFGIDQASSRVIFNSFSQILVAPIDGSAAPTTLVDSEIVSTEPGFPHFFLTPDGSRAVYLGWGGTFLDLYSQPSDGSAPPSSLTDFTGVPLWGVQWFRLAAAGTRVVFVADQDTAGVLEIYSAPSDASAASVKLNGPLVAGGDVDTNFAIDPAGTRVVYQADQSTDGVEELYSSNLLSAASNVKLNGSLVAGGSITDFAFSPSGGRVLYRANQIAVSDFGLFSAPVDGSASPTALYAPAGESVGAFHSSSDESVVVFETLTSGNPTALQRVPFGGGPAVRLSPASVDPTPGFVLLSDVSRVVFQGVTGFSWLQLYAVPVDGSQALTQLSPSSAFSQVEQFAVAPDGSLAIYRADQDENNRFELYSVPPDGSAPAAKVNAPLALTLAPQGDVANFRITADGAHAVYQANQDELDAYELFSVSTTGTQPPLQLNDPPLPAGSVYFDFLLTSDSQRVVYRAQRDSFSLELYAVAIDRSTAPIKLSGPMAAGGAVGYPFFPTPDETRLLYVADSSTDGVVELFSVPMDGSAAPTRLHAPLSAGHNVLDWLPSPDGARAVFAAVINEDDQVELYSAPIDGSASPIKLNGSLPAGGDVYLGLLLGSERVVYGGDQDTNDVVELYSVPTDGSGPALKLSGSMVANGDVVVDWISDDGSSVLYLADQTTDETFELYCVPADGSSAAVRSNGTLVSGGDVTEATISPDGQWVVYLADQLVNNRFELFSVPADGSAPAVRVSPSGIASVASGFRITPDGTRVLFLKGAGTVTNLYSVPIDGSAPALRLNNALASTREVTQFDVDPAGRVLYVANQAAATQYELFRVPVDVSDRARRVNRLFGPLEEIADPLFTPTFAYTPAGDEVLYLADQEWDDTYELFASSLFDGDKKDQATAPTSLVEVETFEAARGHGQSVPLPSPSSASGLRDLRRTARFDSSSARLSYHEDERGGPRGHDVLRDHEELIRLGVHPAFQLDRTGKAYTR